MSVERGAWVASRYGPFAARRRVVVDRADCGRRGDGGCDGNTSSQQHGQRTPPRGRRRASRPQGGAAGCGRATHRVEDRACRPGSRHRGAGRSARDRRTGGGSATDAQGGASAMRRPPRRMCARVRSASTPREPRCPRHRSLAPLERLHAAHEAVTVRWMRYETDPALQISYPAMTDVKHPQTAAYLRAAGHAAEMRRAAAGRITPAEFARLSRCRRRPGARLRGGRARCQGAGGGGAGGGGVAGRRAGHAQPFGRSDRSGGRRWPLRRCRRGRAVASPAASRTSPLTPRRATA